MPVRAEASQHYASHINLKIWRCQGCLLLTHFIKPGELVGIPIQFIKLPRSLRSESIEPPATPLAQGRRLGHHSLAERVSRSAKSQRLFVNKALASRWAQHCGDWASSERSTRIRVITCNQTGRSKFLSHHAHSSRAQPVAQSAQDQLNTPVWPQPMHCRYRPPPSPPPTYKHVPTHVPSTLTEHEPHHLCRGEIRYSVTRCAKGKLMN